MTDYPAFGEDWMKRWVQIGRSSMLHRLATNECGAWEADGMIPIGVQGTTACGMQGRLMMPGMMSRMVAARCPVCCQLAGVPRGKGAPYNDKALSEEERER